MKSQFGMITFQHSFNSDEPVYERFKQDKRKIESFGPEQWNVLRDLVLNDEPTLPEGPDDFPVVGMKWINSGRDGLITRLDVDSYKYIFSSADQVCAAFEVSNAGPYSYAAYCIKMERALSMSSLFSMKRPRTWKYQQELLSTGDFYQFEERLYGDLIDRAIECTQQSIQNSGHDMPLAVVHVQPLPTYNALWEMAQRAETASAGSLYASSPEKRLQAISSMLRRIETNCIARLMSVVLLAGDSILGIEKPQSKYINPRERQEMLRSKCREILDKLLEKLSLFNQNRYKEKIFTDFMTWERMLKSQLQTSFKSQFNWRYDPFPVASFIYMFVYVPLIVEEGLQLEFLKARDEERVAVEMVQKTQTLSSTTLCASVQRIIVYFGRGAYFSPRKSLHDTGNIFRERAGLFQNKLMPLSLVGTALIYARMGLTHGGINWHTVFLEQTVSREEMQRLDNVREKPTLALAGNFDEKDSKSTTFVQMGFDPDLERLAILQGSMRIGVRDQSNDPEFEYPYFLLGARTLKNLYYIEPDERSDRWAIGMTILTWYMRGLSALARYQIRTVQNTIQHSMFGYMFAQQKGTPDVLDRELQPYVAKVDAILTEMLQVRDFALEKEYLNFVPSAKMVVFQYLVIKYFSNINDSQMDVLKQERTGDRVQGGKVLIALEELNRKTPGSLETVKGYFETLKELLTERLKPANGAAESMIVNALQTLLNPYTMGAPSTVLLPSLWRQMLKDFDGASAYTEMPTADTPIQKFYKQRNVSAAQIIYASQRNETVKRTYTMNSTEPDRRAVRYALPFAGYPSEQEQQLAPPE